MLKEEVIEYFGTQRKVAEVLNIRPPAVSQWDDGEPIPELQARTLHMLTKGRLKFRPELYERRA